MQRSRPTNLDLTPVTYTGTGRREKRKSGPGVCLYHSGRPDDDYDPTHISTGAFISDQENQNVSLKESQAQLFAELQRVAEVTKKPAVVPRRVLSSTFIVEEVGEEGEEWEEQERENIRSRLLRRNKATKTSKQLITTPINEWFAAKIHKYTIRSSAIAESKQRRMIQEAQSIGGAEALRNWMGIFEMLRATGGVERSRPVTREDEGLVPQPVREFIDLWVSVYHNTLVGELACMY
ncbi:hypothetical protein V8E51_007321 [Hyaloscypha variabilis]